MAISPIDNTSLRIGNTLCLRWPRNCPSRNAAFAVPIPAPLDVVGAEFDPLVAPVASVTINGRSDDRSGAHNVCRSAVHGPGADGPLPAFCTLDRRSAK